MLLVGNAWVGGGVAAMALAGGYFGLLALTLLAGLGGNAQHPLGAALVSRSNAPPQTATALGVLHFARRSSAGRWWREWRGCAWRLRSGRW